MPVILSYIGITAIVLAVDAVPAAGASDIDTAKTRAAEFELLTRNYGGMSGRPIGPASSAAADLYVRRYDSNRNKAAAIIPDIGQQLRAVLSASSAQLARLIDVGPQNLRLQACLEAGIRRDARCVPQMIKATRGAGKALQIAAAQALIPMPIAKTRPTFAKHLAGKDAALRLVSAYALARHKDDRGATVLWKSLGWPTQNVPESFRFDVANALMDAGQARTRWQLDKLFRLLDGDARRLCPRLAARGDGVALRKLRHCLTDMSLYHGVRKWAAMALGDIRDRRAVPQLRRALGDQVKSVRTAAAAALHRILK
ncbi:MAG: HEAT repeat domain-containing protein [Fimbriimonadales bacterium]